MCIHIICAIPAAVILIVTNHYLPINLQAAPYKALLKPPETAAKTKNEKPPSNILLLPPAPAGRREGGQPAWAMETKHHLITVFKQQQVMNMILAKKGLKYILHVPVARWTNQWWWDLQRSSHTLSWRYLVIKAQGRCLEPTPPIVSHHQLPRDTSPAIKKKEPH